MKKQSVDTKRAAQKRAKPTQFASYKEWQKEFLPGVKTDTDPPEGSAEYLTNKLRDEIERQRKASPKSRKSIQGHLEDDDSISDSVLRSVNAFFAPKGKVKVLSSL